MKHPTSFRVSEQARRLLSKMAEDTSISQTAMLEILIREGARKQDVRAGPRQQAESQQGATKRYR